MKLDRYGRTYFCLLLTVPALLLAACAQDQGELVEEVPTGESSTANLNEQASNSVDLYPGPSEAYPANEFPNVIPQGVIEPPTPSSGSVSTITGILYNEGEVTEPVEGMVLYLGRSIDLADGTPALAAVDRARDLSTQTSSDGQFIFEDVPPGRYVLVIDLITATFLLGSPEGGDLIIMVKGGELVDLGELYYRDLPIPPK